MTVKGNSYKLRKVKRIRKREPKKTRNKGHFSGFKMEFISLDDYGESLLTVLEQATEREDADFRFLIFVGDRKIGNI